MLRGPTTTGSRAALAVLLAALLTPTGAARAGETGSPAPGERKEATTRAEEARSRREEKANRVVPPRRPWLERLLLKLEDRLVLQRLFDAPRGPFLRAGGLTEGSGLGFGPAFRASVPHGPAFTVSGAASIERYWVAEASLALPSLAGGHAFADATARLLEFPEEDFYGPGPDSRPGERTSFAWREASLSLGGGVKPRDHLSVGASLSWLNPHVGPGRDEDLPTTQALFGDAAAPGLAAQPEFLRAEAFARFDDAEPPGNPRRGSRCSATVTRFSDLDLERYSFHRLNLELQRYLPLLHEYRVIALRALLSTTGSADGQEVPFYLQHALGGAYSLRGFPAFRFRGEHLLLLQAEYRWEVNEFMTGAVFVDAGKVAVRREDLDLRRLERDWGIGLRVGGDPGVVLRVDVAFGGREGTRVLVRGNHVF